ncbi:probable RNA-directed DNA polymerase from transposon X-element [Trichonephila clavipes]|nr:probable RNA-directed DNA polymerase from transposon X-element [Trichonephila clavipes]
MWVGLPGSLVYGTKGKADLFAVTLEDSFQENRTPYDDDHIDKVDREHSQIFLRNNIPTYPPLTFPQEICEIIKNLKNKKAPGQNQIRNIALKSLPINAITHLTKIINRTITYNHFPKPISLISSIGKIHEKILLKRIEKYTLDNSIIPDIQHGFRKETSTCHQLLRATNKIISGFNRHATTGGIFLDVEKAFDRLWHNGLIFKMINLNYPPYLIRTISDYLHNRTFQVKIQATISKIGHIQAGSPQGSLLSPILYIIYTHDFPTSPLVDICLFEDDVAILSQRNTPQKENLHAISSPDPDICITDLGIAANKNLARIQIVQNRALRLILNAPTYIKRIHLHKDLKIPSLASRIKKLATAFYDQFNAHSNSLINIQAAMDAQRTHNMPIQTTHLRF